MSRPQYGAAHRRARAELLADDPLCVHCGERTATVADHQPPIALHEHSEGSGCCTYVPSCGPCSSEQAGAVSKAVGSGSTGRRTVVQEVTFDEPDPAPGPNDPIWDALEWIVELRDVPADATWPRWMTLPHPRAVGSYLAVFEEWARARSGLELRWWQRLAAGRILEHDADGRLVWRTWLLSVARQVGKSRLLLEILLWATTRVRSLWEADSVLFTSRSLLLAEALIHKEMLWADTAEEWHPNRGKGAQSLEYQRRFSLILRAVGSAYGSTNGLAVVDEGWDVKTSDVTEGIRPTLLDAEGQLGLVSTAHRRATSLMLNERSRAFETLEDPKGRLILEWSADRTLDLGDVTGWRQASPHWTEYREELIGEALAAALSGEQLDPDEPDPLKAFEAQYLNLWPIKQTRRGAGEPLFETGPWAAALHTSEPPTFVRVVAVEDNYGRGLAVVVAGVTVEERIGLTGELYDDADDGWARVAELLDDDEPPTLLVAASLHSDAGLHGIRFDDLAGTRETKTGLAALRKAMDGANLVHDGGDDLATQMLEARVRTGSSGLVIASKGRHDLVRAAGWAVARVQAERSVQPQVW